MIMNNDKLREEKFLLKEKLYKTVMPQYKVDRIQKRIDEIDIELKNIKEKVKRRNKLNCFNVNKILDEFLSDDE